VILVDADVETPSLHEYLEVPNLEGLSDVLLYGASLERVMVEPPREPFRLVTSGTVVADPAALRGSDRWDAFLDRIRSRDEVALLFVPTGGGGASLLAGRGDRLLRLARPGTTSPEGLPSGVLLHPVGAAPEPDSMAAASDSTPLPVSASTTGPHRLLRPAGPAPTLPLRPGGTGRPPPPRPRRSGPRRPVPAPAPAPVADGRSSSSSPSSSSWSSSSWAPGSGWWTSPASPPPPDPPRRMRLRALRLHGFKSFADRTEVVFHDGITAIVGPNGCGKSNISDAIRWVLGEQRASAIRGARMDEAIFQGTVNRRPVNRAQVSMELSNEDGALPVPFEEVEISRTVYRDGGSDYALNRSACRLRDIQDLCRDTGLGSNAYSIIENRMIDAILSDRADERRGLFEEAAGIGKYKDRRKSASRRLERAEADLQRLEDLIGEVESKVRSLARQKGKAERHAEIRARRLAVDVSLARRQLTGLETRLGEIRRALEGGLRSDESLQAEIRTAEARVERLRADRLVLERERATAAGRLEEIRGELTRWERELAVAAERGEQAARRLGRIGQEREEARQRRERSREEREALTGREAELGEALAALEGAVAAAQEESARVRERLAAARAEQDGVEAREREVTRRTAQLRGDHDAAGAQALELDRRAAHLEEELETAVEALRDLDTQGDLFGDRVETLSRAVEAAREAVAEAREEVVLRRERVEGARREEIAAQDRASALRGRRAALERLEADREGMDPVIRALVEARLDGVEGLLADFIQAEPTVAAAVEAFLGVQARGVVVRDRAAAGRVHGWFRQHWKKGGGLILLPLDALDGLDAPDPRPHPSSGGTGTGPGAGGWRWGRPAPGPGPGAGGGGALGPAPPGRGPPGGGRRGPGWRPRGPGDAGRKRRGSPGRGPDREPPGGHRPPGTEGAAPGTPPSGGGGGRGGRGRTDGQGSRGGGTPDRGGGPGRGPKGPAGGRGRPPGGPDRGE
jgi:hypothetical protein